MGDKVVEKERFVSKESPESTPALYDNAVRNLLSELDPAQIAPNSGKIVYHKGRPLLLIRTAQDGWKAFSAQCTHQNCPLTYRPAEKIIYCPCHSGKYDLQGRTLSGPPEHPLKEYEITVQNGRFRMDGRPKWRELLRKVTSFLRA